MNSWAVSLPAGALMILGAVLLRRGWKSPMALPPMRGLPKEVPEGALPVLSFVQIVGRTRTSGMVDSLCFRIGLPAKFYAQAVHPVIEAYAELVQLLPGLPASLHSVEGGLFIQGVEAAVRVLDYRRGQILPPGAAPEEIGERAHRWTYALFVAALLHDVGDSVAHWRVDTSTAKGVSGLWTPTTGSLSALGVYSYRKTKSGDRPETNATTKQLGLRIFFSTVPVPVREWLAVDVDLMRTLQDFLLGKYGKHDDVFSGMVLRARRSTGVQCNATATKSVNRPVDSANANLPKDTDTSESSPEAGQPPPALATLGHAKRSGDVAASTVEQLNGACALPVRSPIVASGDSDVVCCFMDWLQRGITTGNIQFNVSTAFVHFVDAGMLLVSPRVFREFVKQSGDQRPFNAVMGVGPDADPALSIQRRVLRARWHVRTKDGTDFLTYHLFRHGRVASRFSGILFHSPERFIHPVPDANRFLVASDRIPA